MHTFVVSGGDLLENIVVDQRGQVASEGRIRLYSNLVLAAVLDQLLLPQEGVQLELVDRRNHSRLFHKVA